MVYKRNEKKSDHMIELIISLIQSLNS